MNAPQREKNGESASLRRADGGRVEVLFLRHEPVGSAEDFTGRGFSGRIEPAGPGSLAVAGAAGADLERIAARVRAAVEWS